MSVLGKNTRLRFYLNNLQIEAPLNWQKISVLATFDNNNIQANISTDKWTFVNESAQTIRTYISNGLAGGFGIFQGLPFKVEAYNSTTNIVVLDAFLDLTEGFEDTYDDDRRVKASIKKSDGINSFNKRLTGLSMGYLEEINIFSANDYSFTKYVVQKKINLFEELVAAFMIFMMVKELAQVIKDVVENINNTIAHTLGGAPVPTAPIAGIAFSIAAIIVQIIYSVFLTIAIVKLTKQLIATFIPPQRVHRVLNLRIGISKIINYMGYTFNSNISDLDKWYYLPSNPQVGEERLFDFLTKDVGTQTGIPNINDYGYRCVDFLQLLKNLFNAKSTTIGDQFYLYTDNDNFWIKNSTYQLPSHRPKIKGYNTDELKADLFISYDTDLADEWTIDNFKGTNYEVITDAASTNDIKGKFLEGLDEVNLNVCLPTRKDTLSAIENIVYTVKDAVNSIINAFGGNAIQESIKPSIKASLKQSTNWHSKPKILNLNSSLELARGQYRIKSNAKYLYDTYHVSKSFVSDNFYGQKETYKNVRIGFGISDYAILINNSYFKDENGTVGKVVKIVWTMGMDFAIIDYWIRKPYTKNLKETFIEPSN